MGLFWLGVWVVNSVGYIRSGVTWWFFFALIAALLFAGFSVCVLDCANTWFAAVFLVFMFGCGWRGVVVAGLGFGLRLRLVLVCD